jgi:hypothetical protein
VGSKLDTFWFDFWMGSVKIRGQSFYFKVGKTHENGKVPAHDPSALDRLKCLGAGDSREASLRCGAVGAKEITSLHLAQHENCQVQDIPQFRHAH